MRLQEIFLSKQLEKKKVRREKKENVSCRESKNYTRANESLCDVCSERQGE